MKVTLICLEWPTSEHSGGVSRYAYRLAQGLRELVDLTIVTVDSGLDLPGATMVKVPSSSSRFSRYYVSPLHIRASLKSIDSEIIHSFGDDWMLGSSKTPLVRTFFGSSWSEAKSSTGLRRLNHAVLAVTEKISQWRAATRIAIAPESMELFDCQFLMPPVTSVPMQPERVPSPNPSVVFVGSFYGRKRGHLVEQAVEDASHSLGQKVTLQVVGPESDRDNWAKGTMHVSGASDDEVQRLINDSWVLMAPSQYEGFGIPAFEALALGVPVIATSNPGSRYLAELTKESGALTVVDDDSLLSVRLYERLRQGPTLQSRDYTAAQMAIAEIVEAASAQRLVGSIYSPLLIA